MKNLMPPTIRQFKVETIVLDRGTVIIITKDEAYRIINNCSYLKLFLKRKSVNDVYINLESGEILNITVNDKNNYECFIKIANLIECSNGLNIGFNMDELEEFYENMELFCVDSDEIDVDDSENMIFNLNKQELFKLAKKQYVQGSTDAYVYYSIFDGELIVTSEVMEYEDNLEWVLIYALDRNLNNEELEMAKKNPRLLMGIYSQLQCLKERNEYQEVID